MKYLKVLATTFALLITTVSFGASIDCERAIKKTAFAYGQCARIYEKAKHVQDGKKLNQLDLEYAETRKVYEEKLQDALHICQ